MKPVELAILRPPLGVSERLNLAEVEVSVGPTDLGITSLPNWIFVAKRARAVLQKLSIRMARAPQPSE